MSTILDRIVADREKFVCTVKTLGACKLPSPVRHRKYVADGSLQAPSVFTVQTNFSRSDSILSSMADMRYLFDLK